MLNDINNILYFILVIGIFYFLFFTLELDLDDIKSS